MKLKEREFGCMRVLVSWIHDSPTYSGVPRISLTSVILSMRRDKPKSTIRMSPKGLALVSRMFWGWRRQIITHESQFIWHLPPQLDTSAKVFTLKSRCTTLFRCRKATPVRICLANRITSFSVKASSSSATHWLKISPPAALSTQKG